MSCSKLKIILRRKLELLPSEINKLHFFYHTDILLNVKDRVNRKFLKTSVSSLTAVISLMMDLRTSFCLYCKLSIASG